MASTSQRRKRLLEELTLERFEKTVPEYRPGLRRDSIEAAELRLRVLHLEALCAEQQEEIGRLKARLAWERTRQGRREERPRLRAVKAS
jgi:predicted house-cleaning NTP pyrophosphatase (Maf/HAM1 superfamily)